MFETQSRKIDSGKRKITTTTSKLTFRVVIVTHNTGTATHGSNFCIRVILRAFIPFFEVLLIERSIKEREVREETLGRNLAGFLEKVIVGVIFKVVDTFLDLEDVNGEDGSLTVAKASPFSIEKFVNYHATFDGRISAVVQRRERNLCASARVHGVQVVNDSFHSLKRIFFSPLKRTVKDGLGFDFHQRQFIYIFAYQTEQSFSDVAFSNMDDSLQRMLVHLIGKSIFDFLNPVRMCITRLHDLDHVLDEALGNTRCHVIVELRAGLTTVHIILCILNGYAGKGGIGTDVLRLTQIAMTSIETALKEFGEVMLTTGHGERIEIHVVNMNVTIGMSFRKSSRNNLLKAELLGGFCTIFQHSTHAGVSINVAIFTFVVRANRIHKGVFVEFLAQVGMDFTLASAFITIQNIRLRYISKILSNQFLFNQILNHFHLHLLSEVGFDFQNDFIQHIPTKMMFHSLGGLTDSMEEFTSVMLYDSAVTFDDLSHSYSYL